MPVNITSLLKDNHRNNKFADLQVKGQFKKGNSDCMMLHLQRGGHVNQKNNDTKKLVESKNFAEMKIHKSKNSRTFV